MATDITTQIISQRTYSNKANLVKAIDALGFGDDVRYVVTQDANGRYFPYFIGQKALEMQLFRYFPVLA